MATDILLTELERQQKYLEQLPSDFGYPLFNARHAVESQRKNGYRSTATASREIVDNAIEAGADRIHVVFDKRRQGKRELINAIAFIDNGSGMLPNMARYALSWGGGTHFDEPNFIARFGFGLPNASINQTRRVEVYTRTRKSENFTRAYLDLNEFRDFGQQSVPSPDEADLPQFVQDYLDRKGLWLDHGTVVVWVAPDRLSYRTAATLKEHLVDDFGAAYRYLLMRPERPVELVVEGVSVEPVDPLFLLPHARHYLPPDPDSAPDRGGAQPIIDRAIGVKYFLDPSTGDYHLAKIEKLSEVDPSDPGLLAVGAINVRIARFPIGFVDLKWAEPEAKDTVKRRFEIRKSHKGMSFVRAGREIQTVDAFPKSERDRANGLGDWPLLQTFAYYWAVEVKWEPELDEVFGITNDKQAVRPIEDFWRVLHEEHIDDLLNQENHWQEKEREKKKNARAQASPGPSPAESAARAADVMTATRPAIPDRNKPEAEKGMETEAEKRVGITARSVEEARKAVEQEAKLRPYKIDYFDDEYGPFYRPAWVGPQIVVQVNRKHPFYDVLYSPLISLPGGYQAKEAIDVLLITLAKPELTAREEEYENWYEAQREQVWSPFLKFGMKNLKQQLRPSEEEDVAEESPNGQSVKANQTTFITE